MAFSSYLVTNNAVLRHLILSTKYPFLRFLTSSCKLLVNSWLLSLTQFTHVLLSENLLLLNSRNSCGWSLTDLNCATTKYWIVLLFDFSVRSFSRSLISSSSILEKPLDGWPVVMQPLKARSAEKTTNMNTPWFFTLNPFLLSHN